MYLASRLTAKLSLVQTLWGNGTVLSRHLPVTSIRRCAHLLQVSAQGFYPEQAHLFHLPLCVTMAGDYENHTYIEVGKQVFKSIHPAIARTVGNSE